MSTNQESVQILNGKTVSNMCLCEALFSIPLPLLPPNPLRVTDHQAKWSEQTTTAKWGAETVNNGISTGDALFFQVLQKYYPGGFFGYDKEGAPVFIDPVGRIDFKGRCTYFNCKCLKTILKAIKFLLNRFAGFC